MKCIRAKVDHAREHVHIQVLTLHLCINFVLILYKLWISCMICGILCVLVANTLYNYSYNALI